MIPSRKNIAEIISKHTSCLEEDVLSEDYSVFLELEKLARDKKLSWEMDSYSGKNYIFSLYSEPNNGEAKLIVTERGNSEYWVRLSSFACYLKSFIADFRENPDGGSMVVQGNSAYEE